MFSKLRIGVTMRRSDACDYYEPRNGLALAWHPFISAALPGAVWVALPNIGKEIINTAKVFSLNAAILSGGENYGVDSERDETETALIDFCVRGKLPLIGICRGFQMLHGFFGGKNCGVSADKHVTKTHRVYFYENPFVSVSELRVNSFHANGIDPGELVESFKPLACDADGFVEAAYSVDHRLAGLMWHPERNKFFSETDFSIFRSFFKTI